MSAVLALDIGGTKLAAALVSADGVVQRSARAPTPADPWPVCHRLLEQVRDGAEIAGVGVGSGGPMEWPIGLISPLNIPGWESFPLRHRLVESYPGVPVRVHNDAACVAVGEHWRGAGQGVDNVLGMVVSTGVGGGLVLGGRLIDGATGNAGHIGHVVVQPDGPDCVCGGQGCLEAIARGPAVVAWARERGSSAADGRELAALARDGDQVALAALERAGAAVGVGVASAAALLDVRLAVIGGGLASSGEPFWRPLQTSFARHARLGFLAGVTVVPAALGGEAGLVGAAALVLAGDRYWSPG
ncbi:MAG: ROK family protein [Actinomycetota bacterium]|nr:ROK family protein [Actinomycetota bacterium]